jgi:undecaprenyl-diphosphatase
MKPDATALLDLDCLAYLRINALHRLPGVTLAARTISHSGDGHLYFALGLLLAWFADNTGYDFFIAGITAFAFELPLYITLKKSFRRHRPFAVVNGANALIVPSDKFSLPSGHTAAAFLMATLVLGFFPAFAGIAYTWALLIGMSRIVLGVHYPSDILAGALLGTLCASTTLSLL